MPGMPRIPGRAKKIAYKILGVPPNIQSQRTPEQQKIKRWLIFEETVRVR